MIYQLPSGTWDLIEAKQLSGSVSSFRTFLAPILPLLAEGREQSLEELKLLSDDKIFTGCIPETSTDGPVISSAAHGRLSQTLVASPTGLCGLFLIRRSNSDSPDEDPYVYRCSLEERVTARYISSHELPIDLVMSLPGIRRLISDSYPTGEAILLDDLTAPISRAVHLRILRQFILWFGCTKSGSFGIFRLENVSPRCVTLEESTRRRDSSERYHAFTRQILRDHLVMRCRSGDSYSSEASLEEDAEVGLTGTGVDMELGIGDRDEVGDHVGIDHRDARDDTEEYEADASTGGTAEAGIDPMTAPLVEEEIVEPAGEDSPDSPDTRDGIVRSVEDTPVDLSDAVRDFYHHMSEVRVDRIVGIETAQGRLEADQLIASGDRARMAEAIYSLRLENLKIRAMLDIERDRVSSLRLHMSLSQEEFRQIRRDRDDARGRLRRLELYLGRRFGFRP
ncbi:hypothetical protein Tco_0231510 [Tanacetum coccineum]